MATTAQELKAVLSAEFEDDLGVYTFSAGQTTPAIKIEDGAAEYEEEPAVTGLEIVVVVSPEISFRQNLGGWQDSYNYLVVFKQWDIEKTTLAYRERLIEVFAAFPDLLVGQMRRIVRQTKLDNIETMTVQISETVWVES